VAPSTTPTTRLSTDTPWLTPENRKNCAASMASPSASPRSAACGSDSGRCQAQARPSGITTATSAPQRKSTSNPLRGSSTHSQATLFDAARCASSAPESTRSNGNSASATSAASQAPASTRGACEACAASACTACASRPPHRPRRGAASTPSAAPMPSASRSFSDTVRGGKKSCRNSTPTASAAQKTQASAIASAFRRGSQPITAAAVSAPSGK
jgi:hypothetical protein